MPNGRNSLAERASALMANKLSRLAEEPGSEWDRLYFESGLGRKTQDLWRPTAGLIPGRPPTPMQERGFGSPQARAGTRLGFPATEEAFPSGFGGHRGYYIGFPQTAEVEQDFPEERQYESRITPLFGRFRTGR